LGTPTAVAQGQLRALWVDAFGPGMNTAAEIDATVAYAKSINANALIAQIVRRGDCWCNRASVPRTEASAVSPAPFDPLDTLIARARAQGIEVHAWVIATAMWQGSAPPASPNHVFNQHGPSASGANNWLLSRSDGLNNLNEDYMLDPGHPEAADYIARTAVSIVQNYDVDGINLDRIRYPDGNLGTNVPSWGYNPVAVQRFREATGRTGTPSNTDPEWVQWRRDQVTAILRKIYIESFAIKPRVRVSADTITYGFGPQSLGGWENTRAYAEQLQDWIGWMREGILDLNIPMNYKRDDLTTGTSNQRLMYQEWSDFAKDWQFGRHAAIGPALYLNGIAGSVRQARTAVAASSAGNTGAGWVGYSYRTPDSLTDSGARSGAAGRAELARALTQPSEYDTVGPPVFASAAPVPPMTWKTQPTRGHVRGSTVAGAKIDLVDGSGAVSRSITADGTGWYAFVDLAPGRYRVVARGVDLGTVDVAAGVLSTPSAPPVPAPTPAPSACVSSVGPGIPAPTGLPAGIPGFNAQWYGQSGYPTLCPGERSTAVIAYYNSGSRGWTAGVMGEVAYLGTWSPEPGQDRASILGGDGTLGSPNTGWPRANRIAAQPAPWVGPGQVAWFQFTIQAPPAPGTYRLHLRPLIEGTTWLQDFGVFWIVTVKG
ncbi:MAG: hypothetical protein FJ034_07440, partial [Chloroflexi bacterium]|nr:hypothetical protein [Chloroflexota bacterium]